MHKIKFIAMPTDVAVHYQSGSKGQQPEEAVSDGVGNPCRHCLADIEEGEDFLIFSYSPFAGQHAYAERGPIFLHKKTCERYPETSEIPQLFFDRGTLLIRGYTKDNRIAGATGQMVKTDRLDKTCGEIFENPEVKYIHAHSATYGCYQCRIERL